LFVDLIKAFDTADHELVFALLAKYGAPSALIDVIRRLHVDFKLELSMGKLKRIIDYTVGVRQGDNMAPLLFLFLIQAFNESFAKQHPSAPDTAIEFRHHRTTATQRGRLIQQPNPARTKGTPFQFDKSLFVDDTAYLYGTRAEMLDFSGKLLAHFRRFGLLMHVGTCDENGVHLTSSKTEEAMYFPATPRTPAELQAAKTDLVFGPNNEYYIPFTDCFKYLGCRIHENLTDDVELSHRLTQASNQAAALQNFWRSSADLATKRQIFLAIPVNTALYGCESWTLTTHHQRKLTSFYHKGIRRILHINMHHVEDFHIRNEHVRNNLSVPDILDIVRRRQFNQLGKFARLPSHRLQRRLLAAWVHQPRQRGRPRHMLRHSYVDALQHIIGEHIPDDGALSTWMPMANSQTSWEELSHEWIARRTANTMLTYGRHPLLGVGVREDKYLPYFPSHIDIHQTTGTDFQY
jgi:hypothetical protein